MVDKRDRKRIRLFSAMRYSVFIIAIIIASTFSLMIFLSTFEQSVGIEHTREVISEPAIKTFYYLLTVTAIVAIIFGIYYGFFIFRPLKRIVRREEMLISRDFSYDEIDKKIKNEYDVIEKGLNSVAKELSRAESLSRDFTANISHEIKTPIAVIKNYAELLKLGQDRDEKEKEYIEGIIRAADKLSLFATNVLRLTKLESQEIYKKDEKLSLDSILSECIVAFIEKIDEKKITLDLDIDENIEILSDKSLIELALSNIISNAVKFTPDGGIIRICLYKKDKEGKISINDSGPGIKKEEINRIFDRYFRGENGKISDGSGLGLAMVKRVADILSIKIDVDSVIEKGTTFTLSFPLL